MISGERKNMFNDSSTTASIGRVKNTLEYSLKNKYGVDNDAITEKILSIHGLSKYNFDFIKNYENLIESGIADASWDTNANKTDVSISGILSETVIPVNKIVGFRYLYRKMKELYGKRRAKFLAGEMYDYSLAIADSSQLLKNYCFSVDASKLVLQGRPFGQLPSLPPHRISSYIAALTETIHQLSNHLAGAIAIGTFFLDVSYMMLEGEKKTLTDLKEDKVFRKYVENSLQSFVHSVNHLSRNSIESPFTNVSIFDRPKLKAITNEENMGWYLDLVSNKDVADRGDLSWNDYFIEVAMEIQRIYMGVIDRGDVANDGAPIRFPVNTLNLSRVSVDGKDVAEDKDFLEEISKKEIYRYNVYVSEGMKVSSCCFDGGEKCLVKTKDGHPKKMTLKQAYELPDSENGIGVFHESGFNEATPIRLPSEGHTMYRIKAGSDIEFIATDNHIHPTLDGEKTTEELTKKDFLTINFAATKDENWEHDTNYFVKVNKIEKITNYEEKYVYCFEMKDENNPYFTLANGLVTHNCRLINDSELFELGGQVNSFGGTAISLGSHRVVTINLRRIALETPSFEKYMDVLKERMDSSADILVAHKALLKDLIAKGTQPFMENGWLPIEKMFSTFGLLGYYEAVKDLEKKYGKDRDYLAEILDFINSYAATLSGERKNVFNIEQIPAETMAVRLADVDRLLYGEEAVQEKLYSNQFVPLFEEGHSLWERMDIDGKFSKKLTGGGIVHFSLGEKLTSFQVKKVIDYALESGNEYFALNPAYSVCNNPSGSHTSFGKHTTCPTCGEPITEYITRTVGFFVKTTNMSNIKKTEDFEKRDYTKIL